MDLKRAIGLYCYIVCYLINRMSDQIGAFFVFLGEWGSDMLGLDIC